MISEKFPWVRVLAPCFFELSNMLLGCYTRGFVELVPEKGHGIWGGFLPNDPDPSSRSTDSRAAIVPISVI